MILIPQGDTMLIISQGDTVTFDLKAVLGDCQPVDLTGAVFTTYIRGPTGAVEIFPNSQHTANPDQVLNKGKFTLALSATNTNSLATGPDREIITKIVIGLTQVYYHGAGILTVLPNVPVQ